MVGRMMTTDWPERVYRQVLERNVCHRSMCELGGVIKTLTFKKLAPVTVATRAMALALDNVRTGAELVDWCRAISLHVSS